MIHYIMKIFLATSNGDFNNEIDTDDMESIRWELQEGAQDYVIVTKKPLSVGKYTSICAILDADNESVLDEIEIPEPEETQEMTKKLDEFEKRLYTVGDIAKILNISGETVRRWCRSGTIKTVQLPGSRGKYRFTKEQITNFIEGLKSDNKGKNAIQ